MSRGRGRHGLPQRGPAAAALLAASLLALASSVAAAAKQPQLRMAQPTLVLPTLSNATEVVADSDVLVAVYLQGKVEQPVTVQLSLLLPPANRTAADGSRSSNAWAAPDPDELWLEPASLTWRVGEPAGAKYVRLLSAAELPLSVVLEDSLYAVTGGDVGAAEETSSSSNSAAGQPLLRVLLSAASGAAIDEQRSSTTLMLEDQQGEAGSGEAADGEQGAGGAPLFGFIANQAAYPPKSSGSDNSSSSGVASIPVRLLAGQLQEMATLKYAVQLLGSSGIHNHGSQQFLPSKSLTGFLYFKPTAGSALGANKGAGNQQGSEQQPEQQQLIKLPLIWGNIPPDAEYRLGLDLQPIYNARVHSQPDAVALHIFGTRLGTCPPGTALKQSSSGQPSSSIDSLVSSSDNDFAEEAGFGLFLNGTVIDLSSYLIETGVREYAAMVESDVASVTLCLRTTSQGPGAVQIVPAAGASQPLRFLKPASADIAESACGCQDSGSGDAVIQDSIGEEPGGSSSSRSSKSGRKDGGSSGSSCDYTAWKLALEAGQNQFTVMLPSEQVASAPASEVEGGFEMSSKDTTAEASTTSLSSSGGSSGTDDFSTAQYSLAVVRLADPEHAELESITVKSADDSTVLLCGPSNNSSGSRKLPSRTALDTGLVLPAPVQPCTPGQLLMLNVSDRSRLISLTPALKAANVPGVRVEVNGQVLSRGGDVAADQLEDTTAEQQQRSNASFLPSAFIMGLLPGSHLDAEVVVVAEDGVTARRYPIQFNVVEGRAKQQQLTVAEASIAASTAAADNSSAVAASLSVRQRGWPVSPALQPMCTVCPAGWAAGAANSTTCHMCPPGTYARAEESPECLSCSPGTFAYSWGSSYCKNCIEGTYSPSANASLCLPCPANTTTHEDGQSSCDVPLIPGAYQAPRYAVVVTFWVTLTGLDPEDVVVRAGVNAAPEAIIVSLIRADTAQQFNISLDNVQVLAVRQVARRTLSANVTATLGVEVPDGATEEDIAAALEVERLSADDPIDMLSSDPDRFFGRTTKTLEVQVESAVQGTTESKPGGTNMGLLWGMLAPGILAILAGIVLVFMGCRKSPACAKWRGAAARRLATSRIAPRSVAYSRYSSSSAGSSAA